MADKVGYAGWIGHNNIGDEALLAANRRLFSDIEFIDFRYWNGYDSLFLGGGTILPQFLVGGEPEVGRSNHFTAAIGVGIRDSDFWNQQLAPIDIRYLAGRIGLSGVIRNKYIEYLLEPAEYLSSNILATGYYFSDEDYRAIGEYEFDHLGVRGPLSQEILSKYDIDCELVGDTALVLEPSSTEIQREKKIAVCLQHDKLKWARNEDYLHHVVEFLSELSSEYRIVFLPFQKEDISMHIDLSNNLDSAEFKNYCSPMDVQGAINEIASCEYMIGEKLHANILSACSYTPFISLEYRPKCLDFAASVGMTDYNIRIDKLTKDKLKIIYENMVDSDCVVDKLESEVSKKRENIRQFAHKVDADLV
ncbi:hypothetical protein AArcSl_2925 [Halalkaliarchaeum desulfuricum]|uniref:Polysaccharide pyruvyl transferase domain-containing protein n=1 Tax=Halalkaliarchaeum desulfuricum TaxID=2055893 RepID=A0A343TN64_9EURY|nr:polysaccharide pyruvyl transferase family protein [Halalkaliarchaeum desulfuricum]AUX10536.1 hypothetical protein AArcSl_2925 [Halalkaliarchaeum desulfuricum]